MPLINLSFNRRSITSNQILLFRAIRYLLLAIFSDCRNVLIAFYSVILNGNTLRLTDNNALVYSSCLLNS